MRKAMVVYPLIFLTFAIIMPVMPLVYVSSSFVPVSKMLGYRKSLYLVADHHTAQFDAWKINPDGTATYQGTYLLSHATDPAGVAIDESSKTLFVTSEFSGGVELVNATTLTPIGVSTGPSDLAGIDMDDANDTVYTVLRNTSDLYLYDWDPSAKTLTPKAEFNPYYLTNCSGAFGVALDNTTDTLWVADSAAGVARAYNINTWTEDTSKSFTPSHKPVDIAVDRQRGFVYTVSMASGATVPPGCGSNLLSKYNLTTGNETTVDMGHQGVGVAVDEFSGLVYVTGGNALGVWNTSTTPFTLLQKTGVSGSPAGICIPRAEVEFVGYNVTIKAHCYTEGKDVNVSIAMDGTPTGFNTPLTFTGLEGTHNFTVPNTDPNGHSFYQWSTGETGTTITVSSAGTYTAYYGAYDAIIEAYCCTEGTPVSVSITMDESPTGFNTPHTFIGLIGTHNFTVPNTDPHDHPFKQWNTSETTTTITVASSGTYTAYYGAYNVTIKAYCYTEDVYVSVSITMDGSPTGYNTSHTFTNLTGTHNFTVPNTDPHDHPFKQWNTSETTTTITVASSGTYTAYYGTCDVAVVNVTFSKTVVGQGYCMSINVTVENQGDFLEWFGVVAPYLGGEVIPTPEQWETYWSMGDVNRDGYIDWTDWDLFNASFIEYYKTGICDPDCDFDCDGDIDSSDMWPLMYNFVNNPVLWTYFGLPVPPKGTQRGAKLYPGNQTTLTFTSNTTYLAKGNHTITAYADPVPGETDTEDNTLTNGWVIVTWLGDVSSEAEKGVPDFKVDEDDLWYFNEAFIKYYKGEAWDPNCDFNCDGKIDEDDLWLSREGFIEYYK